LLTSNRLDPVTILKTLFAASCRAPARLVAQTAGVPLEGRLQKIAASKSIAIAHRTDALLGEEGS
jgi:hypothetical protein